MRPRAAVAPIEKTTCKDRFVRRSGMQKKCTRCLKTKPETDFYAYTERDPHVTGKRHSACKQCEHEARSAHRKAHPQLASANARRCKIKRLFGITPEQYDIISKKQKGVCAICLRPSPDGRRLHIDHCHTKNKVRGLLCHDCNRGIGMFRDNPVLIKRALHYLLHHPAKFLYA